MLNKHLSLQLTETNNKKMDTEYQKAIEMLINNFEECKTLKGKFSIEEGELWYTGYDVPNMHKMQSYINKVLNQKVFRAEYICHKDVYARDEKEATEFLNRVKKPDPARIKIYEVTEYYF